MPSQMGESVLTIRVDQEMRPIPRREATGLKKGLRFASWTAANSISSRQARC